MKRSSPLRVMCVDDNRFIGEAVQTVLQERSDLEWAGWLSSAAELAGESRRRRPDIVLLDIDMPGRNVFEVLEEYVQSFPTVRVIMFSGYVRPEYIDRAINAGAWGYVSKNDGTEHMIEAIDRVAGGEFALTPEVQDQHGRCWLRPD